MMKPWMAVFYLGFVSLAFLYLDKPIALYFHEVDLRSNLAILNWITKVGLGGFYLVSLVLLALYFRFVARNYKWEVRVWFLWLCVAFPSLICLGLKIALGRARPSLLFEEQLYGFYGLQTQSTFWSFPSGHSTTIMGLVFGLSILFPRYGYAWIAAGLFVAISRILLTHHYLSDVLIAAYLALLEVGLLWCWVRQKNWAASLQDNANTAN
ncbi:phosphatase PAP2 family protein [Legionella sp. 27cVA30]|nr:phosphatase PAP2 family protein [Legionella sp. 27cVA30]MCP0914327.1 phosphatase PAP2 family protein [Legionella sp. 27cVA30]